MERTMLILIGGRSAIPAIMGALQFVEDADRVKFLLCQSPDGKYQEFQQVIWDFLRAKNPNLKFNQMTDGKAADGNDFHQSYLAMQALFSEHADLAYVSLTSAPQTMAMAAYYFTTANYKNALPFSVYTHTSTLVPLIPGHAKETLKKKLKVSDYIAACKLEIFKRKFDVSELSCSEEQAQNLVNHFAHNIKQVDQLLSLLRGQQNIKVPTTIRVEMRKITEAGVEPAEFQEFLDLLKENKLISKYEAKPDSFCYRIEKQADYALLYGDWLEFFAYLEAKKASFDSVEMSLELKDFNGELDLICVHNANALICECKTGKYDTDDLARLESKATKLGGNYCTRLFVISKVKARQDKDFIPFLEQAKAKQIIVVTGEELKDLSDILKKQMEKPDFQRI